MLDAAKKKDASIDWVHGRAECLPFENDTFDSVICTLAIHHFTDLGQALGEVGRVLRPAGKFVIFTVTPEQTRGYWLTHYFPEMMERDTEKLPSIGQIEACLQTIDLRVVEIEPFLITNETVDFFFYSGKYRPSMYLSENIRNGMSSFRMLISDAELSRGLASLENDIADGTINRIIDDHHDDLGDYCFVVFENKQPREA
jgi:ubiquinone/menaquinone biosynthesis C-methylase UbiE